ncbi:MAG TPA: alkaline phosphatase family protein [Streptosporangiaceae bacterium]|nr:alkaline phosphatase family protein [Streptosporangiaceae bacterium]
MTHEPIPLNPPPYGSGTLSDLARSLLASLRVPGEEDVLGLPAADRVCLLVVDGLGWELLRENPAAAPFLSELAATGGPISAGFPATTVTSLSSLGTGRPPGQHGMLGYQVARPGEGKLLNALRWDPEVDPVVWQPAPTIFQRAAAAGVHASYVAASAFRRSGLTNAFARGVDYRGANSLGELAARAQEALRGGAGDPSLAMVYHGHLDGTGHAYGIDSDAWRYELAHVDKLAEQLATGMPEGSVFYVTADHGMVDVGSDDRIDADNIPALREGVALLGGEPRARHVYAKPGAAADVLAAWRGVLDDRVCVLAREEAIAQGWFGEVAPEFELRIGDVVAAPYGPAAVVATRSEPVESSLVGMHGSLTQDDQLIPLLMLRV